ncbi:MAG: bifunctional folylpolyglutamate synthase/dihydrofolate synthase [Lachnospiraceae bacterium]|nr:bifunctional folylpolyglutamate synthase/dihydrofolate synthase [Lachnospiraceae bacterium]
MNYREAMDYIEELSERVGSVYSLTEVAALSEEAGRPERKLKVIHIAGTNGKGSVSNYISNILAMSGYTVGKYISPAIMGYRERIQKVVKDGELPECEWIPEEKAAELLTKLREACERMVERGFSQPSAFEVETIMAFLTFADWQVDYAVIETGLGGMMDATNIIEKPLQCIFTSLSLEHQRVLGDSLMKIAKEKYGIIKKNAQVISAEQEDVFELLESQVKRKNAHLFPVSGEEISDVEFTAEHTGFSYRGVHYELGQLGTCQVENAVLAVESALRLREKGAEKITEDSIRAGLKSSRWRGRFEVVSENPYVIADGAHNPDAVKRLAESLEVYFKGETFDFIYGVLGDKDYGKMTEILCPFMRHVYTVKPPVARGLSAEDLKHQVEKTAKEQGQSVKVTACENVGEALEFAAEHTEGRKICVCGSLFLLGDVYRKLEDRA